MDEYIKHLSLADAMAAFEADDWKPSDHKPVKAEIQEVAEEPEVKQVPTPTQLNLWNT